MSLFAAFTMSLLVAIACYLLHRIELAPLLAEADRLEAQLEHARAALHSRARLGPKEYNRSLIRVEGERDALEVEVAKLRAELHTMKH